jgi:hypothetical protein
MARSKLPGATLPEATVERLLKCQRWDVCDEGTADICAVALKTVHHFQWVAAQGGRAAPSAERAGRGGARGTIG